VRKIVILFLFCTTTLFAHTNDSLKKSSNKVFPLKYYTQNQFEYPDSVSYVLNTLVDFHNYLDKNTLGNIGLANNDFIYRSNRVFGFNYGRNNYQPYFYLPNQLNFYNTRIPYSDLFYVFGSKQEQYFKMVFSYNIKKNWNMTIDFSRIRSTGFYENLVPNHTFLAVSSNYRSLNNRYMLLISACFNNIKNSENGGLTNDSTFFSGLMLKNDVPLKDVTNYRRNRNFFARQYFNLGRRATDTLPLIPSSRFILTSEYDEMAQRYRDSRPQSGYYPAIYYDSLLTFDTSFVAKVSNELAWKRTDNRKHRNVLDMIGLGASIKHQLIIAKQREIDTLFNNILSGFELCNLYSNHKFWWKVNYSYGVNGYNKGDNEMQGIVSKGFLDSLSRVFIRYKAGEYAPDFMYNQYASNHYKWTNDFTKVSEQSITAGVSIPKYDFALSVDYTNYKNVLYFDTLALARQYEGTVNVIRVHLKKNISFFNWHLNNNVIYQQVPDSSVIRVPQFMLQHSLFYEHDLFKKALRMQIGVELFYNTAFYSNAYAPATGQFYMQNDRAYGN
jgi:hypothetical protein